MSSRFIPAAIRDKEIRQLGGMLFNKQSVMRCHAGLSEPKGPVTAVLEV